MAKQITNSCEWTIPSKNIRVIAVNIGTYPGFDIYLSFSGQRKLLIHHQHNGLLFNFLKDGVRLEALCRYEPTWSHSSRQRIRRAKNQRGTRLERSVAYLL